MDQVAALGIVRRLTYSCGKKQWALIRKHGYLSPRRGAFERDFR
jgi:hypothetical protein